MSVDADSFTGVEKPLGLKADILMLKVFPGCRVSTEKWGASAVWFRCTAPDSSWTFEPDRQKLRKIKLNTNYTKINRYLVPLKLKGI